MSDLREALETAFESVDTPQASVAEPQAVDTPATETQAEADARARDEKGRFAAKKEGEATAAPTTDAKQPEFKPAPAPENPVDQAKPEGAETIKAPNTWRPAAAAKFATLDPEIRAEIEKRENDARMGIQQYKQAADFGRSFGEAAKPFERTFQELGVTPVQAFQTLLAADHKLRYSPPQEKARYFAELAQQYGVSLDHIKDAPQPDPQYLHLQQELSQLRQQQESWLRQQQEQENQALTSDIQKFAADPANQHFEAVRNDMALLIENGRAKSLKEAYDMAVWVHPDIRSNLLKQQTEEAARKAQEANHVQRAKNASASVKGSSPASGSATGPKDSLRAEIEAAADKFF